MSKGLEALERIGKQKYKTTVADITGFETVTVSVKQDNKKDYNIIEKELKALEILRRGNFEFGDKHKFRITLNSGIILTKEEYDLLKEVSNYGK